MAIDQKEQLEFGVFIAHDGSVAININHHTWQDMFGNKGDEGWGHT